MFMVVRPLMRKAFGTDVKALPAPGQAAAPGTLMLAGAAGDAGVAAGSGSGGGISSSGGPNVAIVGGEESVAISNRTSNMIDVAQVQGQVHAQSVQKVGELANKNPQEAISIIRNWLHEDAA
jgi:flagellar M-ring protein FliF